MSQAQKVIKYVAIAFGLFLAINIICGITFGILGVVGISFMSDTAFSGNINYVDNEYEITDVIERLKVDLSISEFDIKIGDRFKLEVSNVSNNFEMTTSNNLLHIKDDDVRGRIFNFGNNNSKITLYVPEGFEFEKADIKTGVGVTRIEYLNAKSLNLELGVGNLSVEEIISKDNTKIDGGVGRVEIAKGKFNNLDLNTGVGEFIVRGILTGNNKIDCGVGKIELTLEDSIENYRITTKTGIGNVRINGSKAINDSTYGSGNSTIRLDGGIGSVEIRTI